ncbi:MAG TPA: anti-sigma factor [Acidobacteriaceae bacterium]|jgi:anti-sigma-K factor RskA|nr:anti-sigma factor [Acidobacteriaceae bacterium]
MNERHLNPEDSDLYALGALDGEEQQALEAHLRTCAACAQELAAARQRVALLGLAAPAAAPPPGLKDALLRRVRAEEAGAARRRSVPLAPVPRRWAWLTPAFALATAVFAALAVGLWMKDARDLEQIHNLEGQLAQVQTHSQAIARTADETDKLLGAPGTVRVALKPMPGMPQGRAGVLYNPEMGMVTCAGYLPAPPPRKSYQLWLVPAKGNPVSLAVVSDEWNVPMTLHVTPGMEARAFAITEEPEGGMPQPTGPKVLVGVGE